MDVDLQETREMMLMSQQKLHEAEILDPLVKQKSQNTKPADLSMCTETILMKIEI